MHHAQDRPCDEDRFSLKRSLRLETRKVIERDYHGRKARQRLRSGWTAQGLSRRRFHLEKRQLHRHRSDVGRDQRRDTQVKCLQ